MNTCTQLSSHIEFQLLHAYSDVVNICMEDVAYSMEDAAYSMRM